MNWQDIQQQELFEKRMRRTIGTIDWLAENMLDAALAVAALIFLYTAITGVL